MPSNQVMKSYTALGVSGGILENVLQAVQSAKSTAVSKGTTQVVDVFFRGHRHDMVWGKILVIPAAVCEGDFTQIPRPLLDGAALKTFKGEDLADYQTFKLADSEFDVPSPEQIKAFKEQIFPKSANGGFAPVIAFIPVWSNPSDYKVVQWTADEESLKEQLCSLVFHVYYNPAFSNLYTELITLEDKLELSHLGEQPTLAQVFCQDPGKSDLPDLQKSASVKRKKIPVTAANMGEVMEELNPNEPVLDQGEVDVFEEVGRQVSASAKTALTMFTPGQVLEAFYPELNEGLLKYPMQNNAGPLPPNRDTSMESAPASHSLNPKPSMVQESIPLRTEMQLRGPGAMDEFYRSVVNIPAGRLSIAAGKTAAATPEARKILLEVLQGACGEIAAAFIAGFKLTAKPMAPGVPGDGVISLSCVGGETLSAQLRGVIRTMNDTDLREVLNDSWAQAAVWCQGKERGFTYEVLVRGEAFDDETLELHYKFVTNLK